MRPPGILGLSVLRLLDPQRSSEQVEALAEPPAAIVTGDVTLRVIGRILGDRTSLTRSGSPFKRPSPHAGLLRHGG